MSGDRSSGANDIQIDDFWWAGLAARALHPVEVQIIEALQRIGRPLSAGELFQICDEQSSWTAFVHHMRRLSRLRAIEFAERPSMRNPLNVSYKLVVR